MWKNKIIGKMRKILNDKKLGLPLLVTLEISLAAFIGDMLLGHYASGLIFISAILILLALILKNLWENMGSENDEKK